MTRTQLIKQVETRAIEIIRQELSGEIDRQDIRNRLESSSDCLELAALYLVAAIIGLTRTNH